MILLPLWCIIRIQDKTQNIALMIHAVVNQGDTIQHFCKIVSCAKCQNYGKNNKY